MFVEFVEICLQEEGDPEFPYLEVSRGFSNITLIPFNQECIVREASLSGITMCTALIRSLLVPTL